VYQETICFAQKYLLKVSDIKQTATTTLTLSFPGAYLVGHENPSLFPEGLLSRLYLFLIVIPMILAVADLIKTAQKLC